MGGGGGPLIDIERGFREIGEGLQRGLQDITGETQLKKRLKQIRKKAKRVPEAPEAAEAAEQLGRERRRSLLLSAQRTGPRRGGTILTSGNTLLGSVTPEPKTLLGV